MKQHRSYWFILGVLSVVLAFILIGNVFASYVTGPSGTILGLTAITRPVSANFTLFNGAGTTTSTAGGGLALTNTLGTNANAMQLLETPVPGATPYDCNMILGSPMLIAGSAAFNANFYESATTKAETITIGQGADTQLIIQQWTGNALNANLNVSVITPATMSGGLAVRLRNDGVNITESISGDGGANYLLIHSEAIASFFTVAPNNCGIGLNPNNGTTGPVGVTLMSFDNN